MKGFDTTGVVGTYAAAKQKGCLSMIVCEDGPVEFLSIAANGLALGVEEEVIDNALIVSRLYQVLSRSNIKGFDEGSVCCIAQAADEVWRLMPVELDQIEFKSIHVRYDIVDCRIDKDADSLGSRW